MQVNGILGMNGVGQAFLVAGTHTTHTLHSTHPILSTHKLTHQPTDTGGVQVLTGVSLSYFTVAALFTGTGEMTVFAGPYAHSSASQYTHPYIQSPPSFLAQPQID